MPSPDLDLRDRTASFTELAATTFDLLVIGGGITGAGIARDAAMRGLSVALVEARDFASGTSSRSSKMVHGGFRYLAQGDLALVREASRERKALRRIAPHLAQTLPIIIPSRDASEARKFRVGIWAYEKLAKISKSERHEAWDAAQLQREEPLLRAERGAKGAVVYPEYLTDDARLTLANVRSAAEFGAVVVNYCAVTDIRLAGDKVDVVEVTDQLPGSDTQAVIKARTIVNAAGPWVDAIRKLEAPQCDSRLVLTKGVHLVLPRERLPLQRAVIMMAADGRSCFAAPRGAHIYLGTTDTFYPEADYWPEITAADVDYVLGTTNACCNGAPLTRADITATWSGCRPMLAQAGKTPSEISRRDEVLVGPGGILSIAGGKLTAYRKMAERVVDRCETLLGRKSEHALTDELPLPGGDFEAGGQLRKLETLLPDPAAAKRLHRLYGAEALKVAGNGADVAAEVTQAVCCEAALTLEDWWVRRSSRARFDPLHAGGLHDLGTAAACMGQLLGWDASRMAAEIAHCEQLRGREMAALLDSAQQAA